MTGFFNRVALLVSMLAVTASVARAGGAINVSPTRLELKGRSSYSSFTLTNPGDAPLVFQIETRAWSEQNNDDVYTPTRDLIVAPPVVPVAANSARVVRVALRNVVPGDREMTYRIIVTQVTDAVKTPGIRFIYQVSMPLFVAPAGTVVSKLTWLARLDHRKRRLAVTIGNEGNVHLTVDSIKIFGGFAGNVPLGSTRQPSDVLAGAARHYEVPLQAMPQGAAVTIEVSANGEAAARAVVPLSP